MPRDYLSPIARYGVFGVSTWPIGCDTPFPLSERFPHWRACEVEVRYPPPQKGYLSDTCAIPYENKANGCDTPLCDTISKRYCAIWGGISHWAAKGAYRSLVQKIKASFSKISLRAQSCGLFLAQNSCEKRILGPELGASLKITSR